MRSKIHRFFYVVLLCYLAATMTTSVYLTNMAWVFLFANWVLEWNWREKFAGFRHNRPLHFILVLTAVTLVWSVGASDTGQTLFVLRRELPLLAIPLVVLTTRPLRRQEALGVALCYVGAVLVMTIVGFARHLSIPDLPYRDIVPHNSHIRFGLNLCLCIVMLLGLPKTLHLPTAAKVVGWVISLWFFFFLFLLHAYTAFIVLLVLAVALPLACWRQFPPKVRWTTLAVGMVAWLTVSGAFLYYHHEYYTLRPPSSNPSRPLVTANGNPYLHRQDGLIENGNYAHQYVCEKEMRSEWQKISTYPFDSITSVNYDIYAALVRYLNAIGATKDSLGMTRLTPDDVAAIEHGIANPVYLQRGPRKLFYVLFYEYENYRCYRNIENFSSLQRLELWQVGWRLHRSKPLLGYGTGDTYNAIQAELTASHSPLADNGLHMHNQYLTFLLAFGWIGFLVIAFFFVRGIAIPHNPSFLFAAHTIIVLVSFMADNTLSSLAGITFVALGFSLFSSIILKAKNEKP